MAATKGQWEPQYLETTKEFKVRMRAELRAEWKGQTCTAKGEWEPWEDLVLVDVRGDGVLHHRSIGPGNKNKPHLIVNSFSNLLILFSLNSWTRGGMTTQRCTGIWQEKAVFKLVKWVWICPGESHWKWKFKTTTFFLKVTYVSICMFLIVNALGCILREVALWAHLLNFLFSRTVSLL